MRQGIAILVSIALALTVLWLAGCSDNGTSEPGVYNTIALQPVRLPTLKAGLVYEGWVAKIDADSNWVDYQSFGKFFWDEVDYFFLSPDDTTQRIDSTFEISGDVYSYDLIAVTLETHPIDNSPDPSPTVVAVSPIDPSQFTALRFPADFSEAAGEFTIGTFSDGRWDALGQPKSNEYSGIWFLNLVRSTVNGVVYETYTQGLELPELPDTGYSYEGWVGLANGDTLSTGKFLFPGFQDYSNTHMKAGTIPNFPGEDFLTDPPDDLHFPVSLLVGGSAFVTIEPNPDNDQNRPSNLLVLSGDLPVTDYKVRNGSYPMANVAAVEFPKVNVYFLKR